MYNIKQKAAFQECCALKYFWPRKKYVTSAPEQGHCTVYRE